MNIEERISAFVKLGKYLRETEPGRNFREEIISAKNHNGWFTEKNCFRALKAIGESLRVENLSKWVAAYPQLKKEQKQSKIVGVIMAGNIPCVGFHDFLCVMVSGNNIAVKLSADDNILMKAIIERLREINPEFSQKIIFTQKMENADAIIATGSTNTSRYFEYYFSKLPHVIRKNRNSVAVLSGKETNEQLKKSGEDIFYYFGLGCRNVSKLFVPENYSFNNFFEAIYDFRNVMDNNKYANNYEYNRTIYLMNKIPLFDNNFVLLKEDTGIHSPVGVLYYEFYKDEKALEKKLAAEAEKIQCIVSEKIPGAVPFGKSQLPEVWDYADNVNTIKFLLAL